MVEKTCFWTHAALTPDRVAIVQPSGAELTFGQVRDQANQLVHALRERGLTRGDGVAFLLPNTAELLITVLAAQQAGWFFTPMNQNLVAAEAAYILSNSDAKAFVTHERYAEKSRLAIQEMTGPVLGLIAVGSVPGFESFEEVLASQPTDLPENREAGSLMSYTSGTTGRPKGVRRELTGLAPEVQDEMTAPLNMLRVFGLTGEDNVHLAASPLYHNAPLGYAQFALQLGHTVVLTEKFDVETFLERVEHHRVTSTQVVPIHFHRLLKLPEEQRARYDLSSLRAVCHAGAPCPPEVKRQIIEWFGPIIYEYYSSGEGVGGTLVTPSDALERPGTVGKPFAPGAIVKILDELGEEMPRGKVGAVYSTLPGNATQIAYYKDAKSSDAARRGDLFTAGDFGYMDDDGYLYLVSRRTDLILSGGVNIYPAEIEAALLEHPAVFDVAVFGVPNDEWGEEVKAVVQTAPGVPTGQDTVEALLEFARERLARFKVPKSVDFADSLPRDPNGKMVKRHLRDPYWKKASAS